MIRHPRTVVGVSDSGAHVSQIIDSSIPTYLLAHWVRRTRGADAGRTRSACSPSTRRSAWGLHDRGLVQEGFVADLVVFDPEHIGPRTVPYACQRPPAGAKRLTQKATGIQATVVNGEVLLRDGEPTGALPGRVIRNPVAAAARQPA